MIDNDSDKVCANNDVQTHGCIFGLITAKKKALLVRAFFMSSRHCDEVCDGLGALN
jgi:hypothetical protein